MSDTLLRQLDLIEPGDLVVYRGSIESAHGLWLAIPCGCGICRAADVYGLRQIPFTLIDPWGEQAGPFHVRPSSVTRSAGCG